MADTLAIIACDGLLPIQIYEAFPEALPITLNNIPHQLGPGTHEHRIERIGTLFQALKDADVARVVFAGALTRPALDPTLFDETLIAIAPRVMMAMQRGDDELLRQVIEIFEEQGFEVVGAHDLLPELTMAEGAHIGPDPGANDLADAERAAEILRALAPVDVGQGCVIAGGQCLGIETIQGTDALLNFVSQAPDKLRQSSKGVYVKAPKQGQDLRVDMPAIGPGTIDGLVKAGLGGIVIEAGRVMVLEREKTLEALEKSGLFLIAKAL